MERRLVKVAKELNVGISTVVEHLNKRGFNIEDKPTAKITDDQYNILLRDFQDSIQDKEKADQLLIGNRPPLSMPKKETPVVQPAAPKKESLFSSLFKRNKPETTPDTEEPAKPLPVQEIPVPEPPVKEAPVQEIPVPEPPVTQEPVVEIERPKLPSLKIVGKIDLNPAKPVKKEPEEEVSVPIATTEPVVAEPAPVTETKLPVEAPQVVKETVQPKPQPEVVAPAETPESTTNEPGHHRAETPQLKGLKILGKIDTDQFKKPKKKKFEKPADANAPKKQADGSAADNDPNKEKRRRRRKKVASSSGDVKRPETGNVGQQGSNQGGDNRNNTNRPNTGTGGNNTNRPNTGTGNNANRPNTGTGGNNTNRPNTGAGSSNNNRPNTGGTGNNTQNRKGRSETPEISRKEVDDKIKATMALLSGGRGNKRQKIRRDKRDNFREKREMSEREDAAGKLQVAEFISVSEFASLMDVSVAQVITTCMSLGVIVSINQRLDAEVIELVAGEFGYEVEFISAEQQVKDDEPEDEDNPEDLVSRAPIVTVMGHVDHGKTSLLDYIRKANVVSGEAGGITQHIGAYEVKLEGGRKITFLDTPGHEAFTAMRARGAKITDVAVIIVAADEKNIMPQTKEAMSHAQAAGVPIIFAINKIDRPDADPARIKNMLADLGYSVEEFGGKYQSQDISAKTGLNIDQLLEKILLESEILELKANPGKHAVGSVLEASLDKGRGYVTKCLVQAGTLHIGDAIVCGEHSGKVKAMFNEHGKKVTAAGPSTPVLILGLSGAPQAGEKFKVMTNEYDAKQIAAKRAQIVREQQNRASKRISLDEIGRRLALGTFKELNLIVKGDMDGSVEALSDSLLKLTQETVQVNVIHKAVGQIVESDVLLASASDAIIIGFQVRPSPSARKLAEREGVQIQLYSIIYQAIEEIKLAIEGMLEPTKEEKIIGQVEIREVYKISKVGSVAGCYVTEGKIMRNSMIRVIRDGIVIYPTKEGAAAELGSLKRIKDDAKEVKSGFECGLTIKNFNDIRVGDVVEVFEVIEVKQLLHS